MVISAIVLLVGRGGWGEVEWNKSGLMPYLRALLRFLASMPLCTACVACVALFWAMIGAEFGCQNYVYTGCKPKVNGYLRQILPKGVFFFC